VAAAIVPRIGRHPPGLALPPMDQISAEAAQARIRDLDGKEQALEELWAERPAVLVFLRHFG
jgi:hypothetical protein